MEDKRVSVLGLLAAVLAINVQYVLSRPEQTYTNELMEKAEQSIDKVVALISNASVDVVIQKNGVMSPEDKLFQEKLEILSKEALKLREKIATLGNVSHRNHSNRDFKNYLNGIQSDAGLLYQNVEDFIRSSRNDKTEVKLNTNFDRDLNLLRSQIGLFLKDVKGVNPGNVIVEKTRRTKRKSQKSDKKVNIVEKKDESIDQLQADYSHPLPVSRRCDDVMSRRPAFDFSGEPMSSARSLAPIQDLNLSWLFCYLQMCPQCTTSMEGNQCPLTQQVLEMKKWANEIQELLTHGCVKPSGCTYPGTCCVAADATIIHTIARVTDMLKELNGIFQDKCVSCYDMPGEDYTRWSDWSSCDATCGRARRSRHRRCMPGRDCSGPFRETEECPNLPDCCVDGNWANWENWNPCSVSCGMGRMTRYRRCSRPAPSYCGRSCEGSREDTKVCDTSDKCCVNGNWGRWSSWSACSSSCGEGRRTKSRVCNNPPPSNCGQTCRGDTQEVEPCYNPHVPANGKWGPWQPWSTCSATCGRGIRNRRRECYNPPGSCGKPCLGSDSESGSCDTGKKCCVDAIWESWHAWSACSATCGVGLKRRRRVCGSPSVNVCGDKCQGEDQQTTNCVTGVSCQVCVNGNWGHLQPLGQCSILCGQGTRERIRLCDNPPKNHCGESCGARGCEINQCTIGVLCDVCFNGNWGQWQSWSQCSVTCGQGQRERRRLCDSPSPNYCGSSCPGQASVLDSCESVRLCEVCVNGNWGQWQSWSQCSVTCGQGQRERRRLCDSPAPNYCGLSCPGQASGLDSCESGRLCEVCVNGNWGQWQSWSQCSVTCGQGQRERRRLCDSPAPNYCGLSCPGQASGLDSCESGRLCEVCVNGNWGQWQSWSQCSVTCGQGQRERRRLCDSPAPNYCGLSCPGQASGLDSCESGRLCEVCVNGNWGQWQSWSQCSVTCGQGQRERRRLCDSPAPNYCGSSCPGQASGLDSCESGRLCEVCVNGNWGQWQSWSQCSVTCGQGQRERRRLCDSPAPNYCGSSCPGQASGLDSCESGRLCEVCVNGNWGQWQSWSQCSVTCGQGQRERRRLCDSPAPNYCGLSCPGQASVLDSCESGRLCEVCVNGNWGQWQSWSQCSVTCGQGQRERRRLCDSPAPNYCGLSCPGQASGLDSCESGRLCEVCVNGNWGQWQSWSQCSVTCGQGQRERRRLCDSPVPNYCGLSCPGQASVLDSCESGRLCEVCVDGNWGTWQSWSSCSVTCGSGTRQRYRYCDNPPFNHCGIKCPGSDIERAECNGGRQCETCVNGNWGAWSPWSPCTVSCNRGLVERFRVCDSPSPNYCGAVCPGPATESDMQQCGPPKIDGQWSTWSSWSQCSVSCGIGSILRSRNCNNPPPSACGVPCPGQTDERITCKGASLCNCEKEWTNWGSWSVCSATCGNSISTRSRTCVVVKPGDACNYDCPGSNQELMTCRDLPACTSWGYWSPCSVTCRGQGYRERIIRTSRPVGRGDVTVETEETRTERDVCTVTEPECRTKTYTYGEWSACSATCRGQGVRSRLISTLSKDVTTGEVTVETDATVREVQNCTVAEPPCLYTDPAWASWDNWCPCDCKQRVRTRRRECEKASLQGLSPQKVPINLCAGEARDEENCDTKLNCPECITDCGSLAPGLYPSCLSCSHYVSCQQDQTYLPLQCNPANTVWDAFTKSCVTPPSPSCTLHECTDTCTDKADGRYHTCGDCSSFTECSAGRLTRRMCQDPQSEWNQQTKRCEQGKSPTCMRLHAGLSSISGGALQREKPQILNCKTKCQSGFGGKYPSCRGCEYYIICTSNGQLQYKRCSGNRKWDDRTKSCRPLSSTCYIGN